MGDETTEVTPVEDKPVRDPLRGLKKANKTLSTERDTLAAELAKWKDEAEKAKLSDTEKSQKALRDLVRERDEAKADALKAKAEREQERKVSTLVAKHGLRDPDFGDIILRPFNVDEHDDFDEFVSGIKKHKKYQPLFGPVGEEEDRVVNEDGEDIVPDRPRQGKSKTGAKAPSTDHEEFARKQFPGDEERQRAYLANIASLGRGR